MVCGRTYKNISTTLKICCSFRDNLKTKKLKKIRGFLTYKDIVLFECGYVLLNYTKYDLSSKNQAHLIFSQLWHAPPSSRK